MPTVDEVADDLQDIRDNLSGDECDDEGNPGVEVRLNVQGESWEILTGDPQYDTDHNGLWGAGFVGPDTDCRELADDLIDQCSEMAADQE